jgi:hypothetical protein
MKAPSANLAAPVKVFPELTLVEVTYSDDQWFCVLIAGHNKGLFCILPERC